MRIVGWRGVGVSVSGPDDVLVTVLEQLPPFFGPQPKSVASVTVGIHDGLLTLDAPDQLSCSGPDGAEGARAAASRIELLLADRLPELAAVHAGVVAIDGRAVLLPGTSMAGKSTLVRALVDRGAEYLSDEFGLLAADGRVHSYPRRMTIRTAGGSERFMPSPSRNVDDEPVAIAVIALLQHHSGGQWSVEPISAAETVLGLVANGVSVRRDPARAMTAFVAAVERAACVRGSRGESDEAADAILAMV